MAHFAPRVRVTELWLLRLLSLLCLPLPGSRGDLQTHVLHPGGPKAPKLRLFSAWLVEPSEITPSQERSGLGALGHHPQNL